MDLAVIPVIFVVQTTVSYLVSIGVSKVFRLGKRPANFVTAMGVSLPLEFQFIKLIISGLRKLELTPDLSRHFVITNTEGLALGQDTRG